MVEEGELYENIDGIYEGHIEVLDHFDIGEEGDLDPEEVISNEVEVWTETEKLPLSRQKRRNGFKKKPGRRIQGSVIHIPQRRQNHREPRTKTYQYHTFDNEVEEEEVVEESTEMDDGPPNLVMMENPVEAEEEDEEMPSTSKTYRVFVRRDGSGMHFDWPIFQESDVSLANVVSIISSNAEVIEPGLLCNTIPQEYTNTGSFVVLLEENMTKEEICNDGLGAWQTTRMYVSKYVVGDQPRRIPKALKLDHNLKIVCEQFIHPGTDGRGDFYRRIYTGFDAEEHMIPIVVISYVWIGHAHPLTVYENFEESDFTQNTWKKCVGGMDEQVPILAKYGVDYNAAISILLSTDKYEQYGRSVPINVRECISFVVDLKSIGGDRALFVDGNEWSRPSCISKCYRVTYGVENDMNSWKLERVYQRAQGVADLQVVCRRYVAQQFCHANGFIRKVHLIKINDSCPQHVLEQLPNVHLAIISYFWKSADETSFVLRPDVGPITIEHGEEVVMAADEILMSTGVVEEEEDDDEVREIMEKVEKMKAENHEKLMELIMRAQKVGEVYKKNGYPENCEEVQTLNELDEMLHTLY